MPVAAEIACCPLTRWQIGQEQGRRQRERDGGWVEARPPRADTVTFALSLTAAREQGRGRCGGGAPAQGRALAPDRPENEVVSCRWIVVSDGTAHGSELIVDCPWFICS